MSNIKLFESKNIRSVWNEAEEKWYFVVADVVQVLTDTPNPSDYIKKMKKRDEALAKGWGQIVPPFTLKQVVVGKKWDVPLLKIYFASFNPFLHQKRSHLNFGWQKWVRRDWKKLKILNSQVKNPENFIN